MSRDAVKFGRMSKKQREKVEEEVSFHQAHHRQQRAPGNSPDSSLVEPPSSTETLFPSNSQFSQQQTYTEFYGSQFPSQFGATSFDEFVDSTTNFADTDIHLQQGMKVAVSAAVHAANNRLAVSVANTPHHQHNNQHHQLNNNNGGGLSNAGGGNGTAGGPNGAPASDRPVITIKQELPSLPPVSAGGGGGGQMDHTNTGFVDSTTPFSAVGHPGSNGRPTPPPSLSIQEDTIERLQNDPERIRQHLSETVLSAHTLTCLMDTAQIQQAWCNNINPAFLIQFKSKSADDLWMTAAQKLTDVITQIIEFAKMLPGFLKFPQEDQIVLLKAGSFELALLRMSRYYCIEKKAVLFMDQLLPMEAFLSTGNTCEMKLVSQIFEFVRGIAELELTETALALYSAYILLQHDRIGLKNVEDIRTVGSTILQTLESELNQTTSSFNILTGENNVFHQLVSKRHTLRELSSAHLEALSRFKRSCRTELEFPPLHGELFPRDL
jgi:nuclear receptor subfamily 1 group F protein 4